MAAQRDRTLHLAVDLQVFGAGDMTLDLQARTEARRIACRGTARASARGCAKRCCWLRRRRYGRWFGLRLLLGPHTSSIIRSRRVDWAPGEWERHGFTLVAWAWRGNHEKEVPCADQTLSVRTGQALQTSS